MTAQRTIARLRKENAELLEANKQLLDNNVKLTEENQRLQRVMKSDQETIESLAKAKRECKQKCELVISEKDRIIAERDQRLQNVKSFYEHAYSMKWTKNVKQVEGGVVIKFEGLFPK